MSLVTFNINLTRLVEAVERLAVVAERAFPLPEFHETRKRGPESIVRTSPELLFERQRERERRRIRKEEGLSDEDESSS